MVRLRERREVQKRLSNWLRRWAWWVIDRWPDVREDRAQARRLLAERKPPSDEVQAALEAAAAYCGVALANLGPDTDLGAKRYEVLHYAAESLGNPLHTMQDLRDILS